MTARAGDAPASAPPAVIRESLQGKYAGFASRFTAFAADLGVGLGVFLLALAAVSFAARVLTGGDIAWKVQAPRCGCARGRGRRDAAAGSRPEY